VVLAPPPRDSVIRAAVALCMSQITAVREQAVRILCGICSVCKPVRPKIALP
jgi:hypothetical protein